MPALILYIILLLALPAAALPTLDEFAARLKPMAQHSTIQAEYTQTRHFKELDFDAVTTGAMAQEQGKRLAWTTTTPLKSICVFTEDSFQFWDEESKRTTTIKASRFPWIKMIFQLQTNWMNGDIAPLQKLFQLEITDDVTLCMTPLDQATKLFFSTISITFSEDFTTVRKVLFTEKTGDTIELVFKNTQYNAPIPPQTWRLP